MVGVSVIDPRSSETVEQGMSEMHYFPTPRPVASSRGRRPLLRGSRGGDVILTRDPRDGISQIPGCYYSNVFDTLFRSARKASNV